MPVKKVKKSGIDIALILKHIQNLCDIAIIYRPWITHAAENRELSAIKVQL